MVSGADKLYASMFATNPNYKVNGGYSAYPAQNAGGTFKPQTTKAEPNYSQFDVYKSPVTSGVSGDKFDMMM